MFCACVCRCDPIVESFTARLPLPLLSPPGHSLGAGVAALLALLLRRPQCPMSLPRSCPGLQALCIGCPAVLSEELATAAADCTVAVLQGADFVGRLSCYSVDRALLELVQVGGGKGRRHRYRNYNRPSRRIWWKAYGVPFSHPSNQLPLCRPPPAGQPRRLGGRQPAAVRGRHPGGAVGPPDGRLPTRSRQRRPGR